MKQEQLNKKRWYTDPNLDLTNMFRDARFFNGGAIAPKTIRRIWAPDNPPQDQDQPTVRWLTKEEGGVYCH